ncbi:hypothetical protein [Vibrio barjaei]|uniref:hypothetical protein n=1 Tax=Vibrio barjaei TaxID=1676683 RepID=UPI0007BB496D|nr:hypothetical protein [Vibrio barjaei]OIN29041.1 hypothetical protein AWH66_2007380 [Vibrio barjaei]
MNFKLFLITHGLIYLLFAIVLFVIPSEIWPLYGVEINDKYSLFLSQHTSIFLGGISAICFLMRNTKDHQSKRDLLKSLMITNALGVLITTYASITGIFVKLGWSDPIFFAVLTALAMVQLKMTTSRKSE